jgi:hypothetical protein
MIGAMGRRVTVCMSRANEHARANSRPRRDCRAPDVTPPAGTESGICTSAHAAPVLIYPLGTFRTRHGAPPRNLFFVAEFSSVCGRYIWIPVAVPGGCHGYHHPSHHPRCLGHSWWRLLRPRTLLLSSSSRMRLPRNQMHRRRGRTVGTIIIGAILIAAVICLAFGGSGLIAMQTPFVIAAAEPMSG